MASQLYIPILLGLGNTNLGFILLAMPFAIAVSETDLNLC